MPQFTEHTDVDIDIDVDEFLDECDRDEIKEVIELPVKHPELFDSLGIAQPKGKNICDSLT